MTSPFDLFVIFAEMRTGSNFLETNLNALDGLSCHGEAFNPHFVGYPNSKKLLGFSQRQRDKSPSELLVQLRKSSGLNGFRYFHDHDPRVLDEILDDPRCAMVMLQRSPVESYVSWKIAQTTGQWKLTDVKRRREAKAHFDVREFSDFVSDLDGFRQKVIHHAQISGQTLFHLDYNDLQSVDVMNGLARYLGLDARLEKLDQSLKVQNPEALSSKVENPHEMAVALSGWGEVDLDDLPDFEPKRAAAVPSYIAATTVPLLYLPIRAGPVTAVTKFMASLDGAESGALQTKMSQRDLRQWKRARPGHRSFTVIRHPVVRAHHAFCAHILGMGKPDFGAIRQTLRKRYNLPLPENPPYDGYDILQHKAAFAAFLEFLKGNLSGQTAIRVDPAWCTQAQALQGFGNLALPDMVIREEEMGQTLPALAAQLGVKEFPEIPEREADAPYDIADIYDDEIERLVQSAYQRDYLVFGFKRWK